MLVFQRMLVRLAACGGWVLKGGFCLEARLSLAARTTRDLDLARTDRDNGTAVGLQDRLEEALEQDPQADGFTFRVARPAQIAADEMGNPGWRTTVRALVGAVEFASVKVDVVARPEEIAGGTELLTVRPPLRIAGYDSAQRPAVDIAQHAAEKLHAYCRVYALDRPSSRVKDLVDLVLMIEADLVDHAALGLRLQHVFAVRDSASPPDAVPDAPASWEPPYARMAAELDVAGDVHAAQRLVRDLYQRAAPAALPSERNA
jgi:hypothetical protein